MNCQDYREIISAHIDGALCAEEQLEVESHLQQCAKCKQLADWERKAKSALKQHLSPIAPRPELRQRVLRQLEEVDAGLFSRRQMLRIYAPAFACLLIFVAIYVAWPLRTQQDIFAEAILLYRQANQNPTQPVEDLGGTQTANLFDLRPWGYQLLSRQVRQVRGQTTRLFVHKGPDEALLVAQELDGAKLFHAHTGNLHLTVHSRLSCRRGGSSRAKVVKSV